MLFQKYAVTLSKQIGLKGPHTAKTLGEVIKEDQLEAFTDEQLAQLYELYQETKKPLDDSTPTGFDPTVKWSPSPATREKKELFIQSFRKLENKS